MHFCPDCGEECGCSADIESLDEDCEHSCRIYMGEDCDDEEYYDQFEEFDDYED